MRSRLIRSFLPLLLVTTIDAGALLFGLATPGIFQDSLTPTYHSAASEVRLVFFATDERNHPVEELQRDDFAVIDDERVIRDFRSFTRSALIKLDVIVLLDSSESVLPQLEQEVSDVQQMISQWPWTPGDNVSVLSFAGLQTRCICAGNCRTAFTADRVAALPSGGATPLFDAVEIAADSLVRRSQPDVWPVIILFSDGDDTISKSTFHEALKKILASGAQVYAIDVSPPGRPSNGTATLHRMADYSGGRCLGIGEGAVRIFSQVIDDLHSARVVTYALPKSSADFHAIRILPTHNLNLQFRSRRGYYSQSGSAHQEHTP